MHTAFRELYAFLGIPEDASVADIFEESAIYWFGNTDRERVEDQADHYAKTGEMPAFMEKVFRAAWRQAA